jgi:HTH-type transcriptional regulator, glycine betaine synthesis regulator
MLLVAKKQKKSAPTQPAASAPSSPEAAAQLPLLTEKLSTLDSQPSTALSPLESSVIDLFVQLSRVLGQPRSYAEIYGLLFISAQPLAMDDLIARLRLSKGSASQGLKYLRQLGAIREIYVPGERRVHYEAVAVLRNLVGRFLRDQVLPQLLSAEDKLAHIAATLKTMPAAEQDRVIGRVKMLQSWGKNARRAVSLASKAL